MLLKPGSAGASDHGRRSGLIVLSHQFMCPRAVLLITPLVDAMYLEGARSPVAND